MNDAPQFMCETPNEITSFAMNYLDYHHPWHAKQLFANDFKKDFERRKKNNLGICYFGIYCSKNER